VADTHKNEGEKAMSRGNHRFKECELTRAIRAAQKANAGACVARITPTGSIEIEIAGDVPQDAASPTPPEWEVK
jgi:hypothetical protein